MEKIVKMLLGGKRDLLWGIINALVVSAVVYLVNIGQDGVMIAVAKQAVYAFVCGSHMVRVARYVSAWALMHYYIPNTWAVWIGISSAFVLNLLANIALHTVEGTPHPLGTIAAIAGLSLAGLTIAGHVEVRRIRQERQNKA